MQFELFDKKINKNDQNTIWKFSNGWIEEYTNLTKKFFKNKTKIRTLSLFSGAGGLDIGFHDAGFEIIKSVEIEELFSKTLSINSGPGAYFPKSTVNNIDIRKFDCDEPIDFIIGGPPCQTFSAAGRRASGVSGTTDSRGVLFQEYVRLLKKTKPKGFLFENVYGILGAQNGEAWKQIIKAFQDVGYKLYFRILDTADYGVPQHRERLIIIGLVDDNYLFPRPTHGPDSLHQTPHYSASEAVNNLILNKDAKSNLNGEFGYLLKDIPEGLNYSFYTEKMGHPNPIFAWRSKFSDFLYKADPNRPCRTLKAQGGQYTGPFHWDSRPFDTNELKRLQTFPDNYQISGSRNKIIHQIGNSVPPQLARVLATTIKEQVFEQGSPVSFSYLRPNEELTFRKRKRHLTIFYANQAKEAISKLYSKKEHSLKEIPNNKSLFDLTNGLTIDENPEGKYFGQVMKNKNTLEISTSITKKNDFFDYIIEITPTKNWALKHDSIRLSWKGHTLKDYAIAWKYLEFQLKKHKIKSDLVQFAGYYQYKPSIHIKWNIKELEQNNIFEKLSLITSREFTRRNFKLSEIAKALNYSEEGCIKFLKQLKLIGLDVRNHNTNSMINFGEILVPYEFPTLYGKSVQFSIEL